MPMNPYSASLNYRTTRPPVAADSYSAPKNRTALHPVAIATVAIATVAHYQTQTARLPAAA